MIASFRLLIINFHKFIFGNIGINTYFNVDIECIYAYYLINGPVVVTSGRNLRKGDGMKISDLANVKVNFPLAHFWIIRKGSIDVVGKPVNEFSKEHIGIRVNDNVMNDRYYFYRVQHFYNTGVFKLIAYGTLNLKHIRVEDVKNLPA